MDLQELLAEVSCTYRCIFDQYKYEWFTIPYILIIACLKVVSFDHPLIKGRSTLYFIKIIAQPGELI